MGYKEKLITPEMAVQYLNRNGCNRDLRDTLVAQYADDMGRGRWRRCVAPIAFYADGVLADGQHRLWAIIDSQKPQTFAIMEGLEREDGLNIDTGKPRTLADNARISGVDADLSNLIVATARMIEEGERQNGAYSNARRLDYVLKHREAAGWACSHAPRGPGIRNSIVIGATGRAWYHERDTERLAQFSVVLTTGHHAEGDRDSAAVALRNFLLKAKDGHRYAQRFGHRDVFLRSMHAIWNFMRGRKLLMLKAVQDEAYPLP